jgi:hypothetical protein
MEKKQSSIDWLVEQLIPNAMRMFDATTCNAIEQAKAMHKEEMDKVAGDFWNEGASYMHDGQRKYKSFDDYYNEIFGGDNE